MTTAGEIVRATLKYDQDAASEAQNVFHWIHTGPDYADNLVLVRVRDWAEDDWGAAWADMAATTSVLRTVVVDVVDTAGELVRTLGEETINLAGTLSGGVSSVAASGYLQAATGTPGVYGRKYVPFVADNRIVSGEIEGANLAFLVVLLLEWLADIALAGDSELDPGVLSKAAGVFRLFTGASYAETTPAYQRRRKPGVGS